MQFSEFEKLVLTRQACRNFNGKSVDKKTLQKICELCVFTPSACNSQPWNLYAVHSKEGKQVIGTALQKNGRNAFLQNAGAFIVISEKPAVLKTDVSKVYPPDYFVKYDIGEMLAYLTLTAKTLGVESCIIGWTDKESIKNYLKFDDDESCTVVVALGYSEIETRKKIRRDKEDVIKYL